MMTSKRTSWFNVLSTPVSGVATAMLPVPLGTTDTTTRQRSLPSRDGTVKGLPWRPFTAASARVGIAGPQSAWFNGSLLCEIWMPAALLSCTQ